MQNVTISMDENLLAKAREYAKSQGTTFNQLVRDLIKREVTPPTSRMEAMFRWADENNIRSEDGPMTREEAHER